MATAGKVMPRPMGTFDLTAVYDILDMVTHNNKLWISKVKNNVGNIPVETDTTYWMLAIDGSLGGLDIVAADSTDGVAYTATVNNMTELVIGQVITIIPSMTSKSTTPTLNVNGLGAKAIKRRLSGLASMPASGLATTWLYVNSPLMVMYDGNNWIVIGQDKPMGSDIYGSVVLKSPNGTEYSLTVDDSGNLIATKI